MKFEKLRPEHIKEVHEIEKLSFKDPHTVEMISSAILNPACEFWLLIESEKILGFIEFWIMYEESHIIDIAVHPEFRKKGYGQKLMEFMIEKSRELGAKKVFLEVRPSNQVAINLYKKCGFSESGLRKKYYKDEDAIIMKKDL